VSVYQIIDFSGGAKTNTVNEPILLRAGTYFLFLPMYNRPEKNPNNAAGRKIS